MGGQFQIPFGIVCEDSRREDNGKLMFIGVFGQNIIVQTFPAQVELCLVAWMDAVERLTGEMKLRILLDTEVLVQGAVRVNIDEGRSISAFPRTPIVISRPGDLSFELNLEDGEWKTAAKIPVIHRPITASSESGRRV